MTIGSSASGNLFVSANLFAFNALSTSTGLIVLSPSTGLLLLVVLDMTKLIYIRKLVTSADNTTTTKILKGTRLIAGIFFLSLDKA